MAFDNLTEKLQNIFKSLKGKGRLTEADVKPLLERLSWHFLKQMLTFGL